MTYQIIITEETAANITIDNNTTNVSITTNEYPITIEYNAVIEQAGGNTTYGDSNVRTFLASGTNTGNIITTANVSGVYILGNGSQLTGLPATYGNANVAANLAAFGSNPISTTGNITAGYFAGNGSLLTNITAGNITGTVANATYALNANAATYATNAVQAATANVANSVAGANVSGTVANATYALNANASTYSTNAIQANVANVANSVAGANVTGTVANATYALNSNAATFAGTVTTAAQPNISSVGILTAINTSGNISATGNITGNYFLGNGSQLTGLPATYGNANVAANLAAFANNPISTSGNITSGNLNVTIDAVITGNLTVNGTTTTVNSNTVTINDKFINVANNASTASLANGGGLGVGPVGTEYATLTYNSAGNIWTTNIGLSVAGNVTGNVFTGNGAGLTDINAGNIVGAYGNANVSNFLANGFGSNTITTTGNITGGNINTANYVAFGTTGAQTTAATGEMFWDVTEQTVSLGMNNGVTQQIGLEQYILVKASATITNGQAVMFTGANGDNVLAAPADTTSVGFRPEYIIGIATQDIANNAFGYITTFGSVHGLNTNAYTVGDILWVSNSTPGALTNIRPTDPNFQIEIAAVTKKAGGDGHIQVRVTPFNNIDSLTDVTITTPSTGQALVYSGNVWINGNPQLANTANTVTNNAQANITSVGTLTSLSVSGNIDGGNLRTAGQVSATGNVSGGNVIVPINGRYYGDFTTATASGRTAFQTTATGTSSATSLTAIPGPNHVISNTGFSTQLNLFANGADVGNSAFGRLQMFGNRMDINTSASGTGATGNLRFAAGAAQIYLFTSGNTGIGNANPQHSFSTNESYFAGNISVTGNVIASNVNSTGEVTTIGNVTGGNIATGNLTITPNVGQIGNVIINTTQPYVVQANNTITTNQPSRIVIGNGWDGNYSSLYDPTNRTRIAKLAVWEKIDRTDTAGAGSTALAVNFHQQRFMNGNVTTGSTRNFSVVNAFNVGGGPLANVSTATSPVAFAAMNGIMHVGNVGTTGGSASQANVGNTSLAAATAGAFINQIWPGSNVTTIYGVVAGTNPGGSESSATNVINYTNWNVNGGSGTANLTPTTFVSYYHANSSSSLGAVATFDAYRAAPNYYAFRNDDDVAQVKLGSLRSYNEFQYPTATSGTVNIDKTNAQVQFLNPTANVTIGDFQNFVTTASNSVSNLSQTDTVTLIIQQGATPYTVSMPTGNASIKYAGGVSTIGATANAVTMVSISAIRSAANATLYLASVSSEFS